MVFSKLFAVKYINSDNITSDLSWLKIEININNYECLGNVIKINK